MGIIVTLFKLSRTRPHLFKDCCSVKMGKSPNKIGIKSNLLGSIIISEGEKPIRMILKDKLTKHKISKVHFVWCVFRYRSINQTALKIKKKKKTFFTAIFSLSLREMYHRYKFRFLLIFLLFFCVDIVSVLNHSRGGRIIFFWKGAL